MTTEELLAASLQKIVSENQQGRSRASSQLAEFMEAAFTTSEAEFNEALNGIITGITTRAGEQDDQPS